MNVASLALGERGLPRSEGQGVGRSASGLGIASVGLAIGPTVGAVRTETLGWRSIFFVNVGIAVVGILSARRPSSRSRTTPRLAASTSRGQVRSSSLVGTVTYALIEDPHVGWLPPNYLRFAPSAWWRSSSAFIVVELRARDPMMDVRVFGYWVYTVAILTLFAALFCDLRPAADHHAVLPERGGLQPPSWPAA